MLAGVPGVLPCAAELSWHPEKGFRWAELPVPREGKPGFTLLPPEQTGITFTNSLRRTHLRRQPGAVQRFRVGHRGHLPRRAAGHFFLQPGRAQRAVQEPGGNEIQGRDGGVRDQVRQPDLPRGGVCGHQRGRLAGFAGQHDGVTGCCVSRTRGTGRLPNAANMPAR